MQNTRLNTLVDSLLALLRQWFFNPWRRLSLLLISLLFGFFLGTAIPTLTGQNATWDITVAGLITVGNELIGWAIYRGPWQVPRPLAVDCINAIRVGWIYGLVTEAFKLGS